MFAVYVDAPNPESPLDALIVGERPEPQAAAGEVRVAVTAASLNWHDLWTLMGLGGASGRPEVFPMILGCDGVGTLDDGTPVALFPLMGDPQWRGDETLDPSRHVLSEQTQGSFADFIVVPQRNAVPLPDGIPIQNAAVLGAAWLTAYRMLFTKADIRPGQTILVQGASGGVATALIQLGRAAGLQVWVSGRGADKRRLAEQLGAQRTFESGEKLPHPVDAVLDMVGAATFEHSMQSVKTGGVIVLGGAASGLETKLDIARVFIEQLQIKGVFNGTLDEFRDMLAFIADAGIVPHIGDSLPMEQAAQALGMMMQGQLQGKIVLTRKAS